MIARALLTLTLALTLLPSAQSSAQTSMLNAATENPKPMPFVRGTRSPFVFPATAAPQSFVVTQPEGLNTYRAYNPCVQADVRIMTVSATQTPVATEATAYPGVRKVTSPTESVSRLSGLRFGRGPETIGSAANPMGGADRIVSIMLVPIPGYTTVADIADMTCEFELQYGTGS